MDDRTTQVRSKSRRPAASAATQRSRLDTWVSAPADEPIVAAMGLGGVDYMFFNSGSEIMFMQEAIAKANALGRPAPKLIIMTHKHSTLNAALGYAAASGGCNRFADGHQR